MSEKKGTLQLKDVLLSAEAFRAWEVRAQQTAQELKDSGLRKEQIPDEQVRLGTEGTLVIFVSLPDGSEVSLEVPKGHWTKVL